MPQKAKGGGVTQYSVASGGSAAEPHIGGSLGGIAAQGMGYQQHAVTRRSAVRLEADAAAAASTGSTSIPIYWPLTRAQRMKLSGRT